jgi:hypothetical protein
MSKELDLKAIFGDPDNISAADNPVYQFHNHMDEIYISGLPEDFPCQELQTAFEDIARERINPLPAGIWFAQLEEDRTTIIQMIFADMIEHGALIDVMTEAVDHVLHRMGAPLEEQSYYMVPMVKQHYDEALEYANSLGKPSPSGMN